MPATIDKPITFTELPMLLSTEEMSQCLKAVGIPLEVQTLEKMRMKRRGPTFIKLKDSRTVRYTLESLRQYVLGCVPDATTEDK